MMASDTPFYKDSKSHALVQIHPNDGFHTEQTGKAHYFIDGNYRTARKHDLRASSQLPRTASSPPPSTLPRNSGRRYVIEGNRQFSEPQSEPRWSSDGRSTDRGQKSPKKRPKGFLTRTFHYIVAPPIIREGQRKQHEDDQSADKEFEIDYSKASVQFARRLLAEMLGTILFILVFGSCAIEVGEKRLNRESAAFATGFMSLFLAFTLGSVSGAHLNPIVTVAFALRSVFPWMWIPFYFLAQFLGSIAAPLLLKLLFRHNDVSFVLNSPRLPIGDAFLWEAFLTSCMMFVILQTATKGQIIGPQAAFGLASVFIFIGLIGAEKSSVSLNPFRSIGPALIIRSEKNKDLWLFIVAPIVGMVVALVLCGLLQGFKPKSTSELKTAQGNETKITTDKKRNEKMDA